VNSFAKSTFPAPRSQIAHLKRQTGERSGELLREKHFPSRISNRFPNPAFILEIFWKNTCFSIISPQISNRFPNPAFILEIFWKNTCHLPVQPQISSRFPNPAFILEIFWKSTAMPPAPHKRIGSNRLNQQFDPICFVRCWLPRWLAASLPRWLLRLRTPILSWRRRISSRRRLRAWCSSRTTGSPGYPAPWRPSRHEKRSRHPRR